MNRFYRPGLLYPHLWFGICLLIATFIVVICLMPARDVPDTGVSDKFIHVFSYTVLALCFASILQRRRFLVLLVALAAFGGLIELAQAAMHLGRHAEWADLLADVVGSIAGIALAATPLARLPDLLESTFRRVIA